MQRRSVVDSVSHIPDDVPGLLQRENDARFLVWLHFGKDLRVCGALHQSHITDLTKLRPRDDLRVHKSCLPAHICGHEGVVTGNKFKRDAEISKTLECLDDVRAKRVKEK